MYTAFYLVVMFSLSSTVDVTQFGPFSSRKQCEEAAVAITKAGKGWRGGGEAIDFATCIEGAAV